MHTLLDSTSFKVAPRHNDCKCSRAICKLFFYEPVWTTLYWALENPLARGLRKNMVVFSCDFRYSQKSILKKITPGSLALYFEKKNESQLGAKRAKWAKWAKMSQIWDKGAKSCKFLRIFGGARIDKPNIWYKALMIFILAQEKFFIMAQ